MRAGASVCGLAGPLSVWDLGPWTSAELPIGPV